MSKRNRSCWGSAAALVLSLGAAAAWAAAGDLDGSYGSGGIVVESLPVANASFPVFTLQPGGRALLGGTIGPGTWRIQRHAADGTLDTTFGTGGTLVPARPALDMLPHGSGLLVLQASSTLQPQVVRRLEDGSLDTAFGARGTATVPAVNGYTLTGVALALQPDGRILVAGRTSYKVKKETRYGNFLARFLASGAVDTTLGGGGISVFDLNPTRAEQLARGGLAVRPNGVISLGVTLWGTAVGVLPHGELPSAQIACFLPSGAPDTSFVGVVRPNGALHGLAVDVGGGLLASGLQYTVTPSGTTSAVHVTRYLPSGAVDLSFGTGGATPIAVPPSENMGGGIALGPNGRILVVAEGGEGGPAGATVVCLARLLANGALDTAFGTDGLAAPINVNVGGLDRPLWGNLAVDAATGDVYVGGMADSGTSDVWWVARLLAD